MKYPNPNMLLRIAQGDAYCMATEFIKLPAYENLKQEALKFEKYLKHPTHTLGAGRYTDDTQMSIAVAEVLLGDYGNISRESFAEAFVKPFIKILEMDTPEISKSFLRKLTQERSF